MSGSIDPSKYNLWDELDTVSVVSHLQAGLIFF